LDEAIAHKLFGDLNQGLLGSPGDDNIIISSNSEEEGAHEDDCVDTVATPSLLRVSPAPSASTVVNSDSPDGVQNDSSDGGAPNLV
jgi:hypothetical protein